LYVLSVSVTIELIGAIATYFSIRETVRDVPRLIFISIFHSISSFANAGFDLFGTSLSSFNQNTPFLLITGLLIIAGAIGYPIYIELLHFRKKKSLYFKVNLYVHSLLIVIGTALFSLIEWKNDLFDGFGFTDKLTNLWFLAVSPRNAGYFSFDLKDLSEASLLIVMILMFIGGSSSSTSGGIRTSTLAVLFAKCKAIIKGQEPNLFKRSISKENVDRSILIFFVFFCLFFVPTIAIMVVEKMKFMPAGFEVMSAVTTTGLSLGITADLTVFSKIILSLLMLLGRIGFITFIYVWTKEEKSKMRYTKEDLIVG
jgi:Trk-type K+ transport system membrane component